MIARFAIIALICMLPNAAAAVCIPSLSAGATAVSFGVYDPGSASSTKSMGTIMLQCLVGLLPSFTVALSTGGSGSYTPRKMANGTSTLNYNLYTDSNDTMIWGDGTGTTSVGSFNGLISLGGLSFTVYGRVPKAQYPAPGPFTDTITVTVTY